MQSFFLNNLESERIGEYSVFVDGIIGWLGFKFVGPLGYPRWLVTYHVASREVKEHLLPQYE